MQSNVFKEVARFAYKPCHRTNLVVKIKFRNNSLHRMWICVSNRKRVSKCSEILHFPNFSGQMHFNSLIPTQYLRFLIFIFSCLFAIPKNVKRALNQITETFSVEVPKRQKRFQTNLRHRRNTR